MIQKKSYLIPINKLNIWWVSTINLYFNKKKFSIYNKYIKVIIKIIKLNNILKKKAKHIGLINFTRKEIYFIDGSLIKFKINSIILLKKKLLPYGKELFNPSIFKLKRKKLLIYFSHII